MAQLVHPFMNIGQKIRGKLERKFSPSHLEVIDESLLHAGHAQAQNSGGGHYAVTVVSDLFGGKTLLERHQAIYDALGAEMKSEIHALKIKAFSSDEWRKENRF